MNTLPRIAVGRNGVSNTVILGTGNSRGHDGADLAKRQYSNHRARLENPVATLLLQFIDAITSISDVSGVLVCCHFEELAVGPHSCSRIPNLLFRISLVEPILGVLRCDG